jgi:hypothetical protein
MEPGVISNKIDLCKLNLAQMIRFFVVELIHPDSNLRFGVSVIYLRIIILSVVVDVFIDSEILFD